MESIIILIPVTLVLIGVAVAAYLWSVSSGQFEDLDKAASSILFDDPPAPSSSPLPLAGEGDGGGEEPSPGASRHPLPLVGEGISRGTVDRDD